MGAGQSGNVEIGGSSMGYQVLRVYPDSPGSRAGLKAYFDFIVAIGNTRFNKENESLKEILKASIDQNLKMIVYNTRMKSTREVEIVPSTTWGGNGLLGVSIKHSSFNKADERVWHIIDVEPNSPAAQAGFKATEDYVIGSDSILQENDDLYNLIEAHEGKALKLFVYNTNSDNCREVVCHPNSRWGGKGFLGCEFGHGLLHRIPFGSGGDLSNDPRAPLLRNEHQLASREKAHNTNNFQSPLMQQQMSHLNMTPQPGQHLFQKALSPDVKPQVQHSFASLSQSPSSISTNTSQQSIQQLPPPPPLQRSHHLPQAQILPVQYQHSQNPQIHQQQPPQLQQHHQLPLQSTHHQQLTQQQHQHSPQTQPQPQQPPPPPQPQVTHQQLQEDHQHQQQSAQLQHQPHHLPYTPYQQQQQQQSLQQFPKPHQQLPPSYSASLQPQLDSPMNHSLYSPPMQNLPQQLPQHRFSPTVDTAYNNTNEQPSPSANNLPNAGQASNQINFLNLSQQASSAQLEAQAQQHPLPPIADVQKSVPQSFHTFAQLSNTQVQSPSTDNQGAVHSDSLNSGAASGQFFSPPSNSSQMTNLQG